ncbi:zealexin A1 synthase-like [Lolium rigidum]|uniref:zealexin A1 synthase-like n=1 Tax=Lolium rigidum TaxID=89674 RepID=UPI001F5CBE47|nr:zealexin A1 synthase-like [Lolium rigidum]
MEQLTNMRIFLAIFLPLLVILKARKRLSSSSNAVRLPPGPWQLPVIGSLHHLLHSPLPYRAMADLARRLDAPLMSLRLGELPVVVASSPDAARELMKTHDVNFATRPWSPTMRILLADGEGLVFAPYGPLWRQLRRISILELLSARRVQSFRRVREEEVGRLVAAVAAVTPGEAVNVSRRIAETIMDMTMRSIMGDRFEKRDEFMQVFAEGVKITSGFNLGDLFPSSRLTNFLSGNACRAEANHRKNGELVDSVFRQHEEKRAAAADGAVEDEEDLVDVLMRIQKEGSLEVPVTTGIIRAFILDLFASRGETTANALQWAMSELMRNPEAMQKAQTELRDSLQGKTTVTEDDLANMKYLKLVIMETLRLHPVVPLLLPRECRETCKVMEYDVPKGTTVFVNVWAISRNPKYWVNPEEFKPERFESGTVDFKGADFEFLPFGAGRRMCPGVAFAVAGIELALASLLYHFRWELPAGVSPRELDMTEKMGITVGRKNDLYLHPVVSVPSPAVL